MVWNWKAEPSDRNLRFQFPCYACAGSGSGTTQLEGRAFRSYFVRIPPIGDFVATYGLEFPCGGSGSGTTQLEGKAALREPIGSTAPNCPFGLVGGSSILTGKHGTGLESKIPIYDAAARLTTP